MDWRLSEEQEMLKKSAQDFLRDRCPRQLVREMERDRKGYSPQLWQEMANMGWMGLLFPAKYNGSNMKFLEMALLLEEMGRVLLPGPFFSSIILGGLTILDFGNEEQKEKYLTKISKGELIFTLALIEPSARYDPDAITVKATAEDNAYIINGTKLFVPDAHIADYIICVARTADSADAEAGITIFIVDAASPGISCTLLETIAHNKLCEVIFDGVRIPAKSILAKINNGWNYVQKIIERAAVAKCCEMVGGMQQVLEMTVAYTKQRVQFGAPIGSFQAIQHHCANMMIDVESSKLITYEAAWRISEGKPYSVEASMAKAWVSDAYRRTTVMAEQVIGGAGIIEDHDMPLFLKRAKSAEFSFGDARYHKKKVAKGLKLKSAEPYKCLAF